MKAALFDTYLYMVESPSAAIPTFIQYLNIYILTIYRSLEKFTVGCFCVKFVRGKIFSSLGVSNE